MKNATLIYNPIAGRQPHKRDRQVQEAAAVLEKQGIRALLAPTTGPDSARNMARALATHPDELIIVCGGDGTINEVINGMTPGSATLAILPGGTANIFAKELGLPHGPVRAARQFHNWSPRRIALGRATWSQGNGAQTEHRFFLSLAGIGFDAYVVHKLSSEFKMACGVIAYVSEALRQAIRFPFPLFICRMNNIELQATFAVVQRTTRYAGWLRIAPSANIFEPKFSLCAFQSRHWLRYFLYASAVITRQHLRLADVSLTQTHKVVCEALAVNEPTYFELDGELVGKLPATFEIIPDALTVLVPSKTADGRR